MSSPASSRACEAHAGAKLDTGPLQGLAVGYWGQGQVALWRSLQPDPQQPSIRHLAAAQARHLGLPQGALPRSMPVHPTGVSYQENNWAIARDPENSDCLID